MMYSVELNGVFVGFTYIDSEKPNPNDVECDPKTNGLVLLKIDEMVNQMGFKHSDDYLKSLPGFMDKKLWSSIRVRQKTKDRGDLRCFPCNCLQYDGINGIDVAYIKPKTNNHFNVSFNTFYVTAVECNTYLTHYVDEMISHGCPPIALLQPTYEDTADKLKGHLIDTVPFEFKYFCSDYDESEESSFKKEDISAFWRLVSTVNLGLRRADQK